MYIIYINMFVYMYIYIYCIYIYIMYVCIYIYMIPICSCFNPHFPMVFPWFSQGFPCQGLTMTSTFQGGPHLAVPQHRGAARAEPGSAGLGRRELIAMVWDGLITHRIHVWYVYGNIYHQYTPMFQQKMMEENGI